MVLLLYILKNSKNQNFNKCNFTGLKEENA